MDQTTKPLDAKTWPDFAQLAESHHGFERVRPIGKHHWVVSRFVG